MSSVVERTLRDLLRTSPMRHARSRVLGVLTAAALSAVVGTSARADDTEIFMVQPASTIQPNILLIIDTSGSMNLNADSSPLPYDPTQPYDNAGTNCDSARVYYYTSSTPPSTAPNRCNATGVASFPLSDLKCKGAIDALTYGTGASGPGYYSDRFIRWGGTGSNRSWNSSMTPSNAAYVECFADQGIHGADTASAAKWPQTGTNSNTTGRYTSTAGQTWWTGSNVGLSKTLYTPNYIRYVRNGSTATQTRMEIVKAAAASFLSSLPNVNVGVMRYSANSGSYSGGETAAAGGMVMSAVSPLNIKRATLIDEITNGNKYEPFGYTPLSETLFEAFRYFSGGPVLYGASSRLCNRVDTAGGKNGECYSAGSMQDYPSVAASRNGANYISPATESCQANYIVFLTDGLPTEDTQANNLIKGLPDFNNVVEVSCGNGDGQCLGALAEYMYEKDLPSGSNVKTFFIGFGSEFDGDLGGAFGYLDNAAKRGGGVAYQANDFSSLSAVFNNIITSILQTSTTFTTPTVAVNAFNRTQTLDDLFVSVFQPNSSTHWPGNLKKYRIDDKTIKDNSNPAKNAVDPDTGFFDENSKSYWSNSADGAQVTAGGAASRLPAPNSRHLYTYLGTNPTDPVALDTGTSNLIHTSNDLLTDEVLGLGSAGDPTRDNLIDWARGVDVRDEDGDAATTVRKTMGDPIHSPPAVVIYGGTTATPDLTDAVVFLTTNDGFLHAIDTESGQELWGFVPQEFLTNLRELYFNGPVPAKQYTLDGQIRVLKYDVNGDGIVDPSDNDRVILYFGTGRGGSRYFAVDVTDKTSPKFMWSIGATELPGLGQAWSTPQITRVNISGATQNSQKLVLAIGGGYDPAQDGSVYNAGDSVGNRLFFVDAIRGTRLWSAGLTGGTGVNLEISRMTHSIPSDIAVLDTNTDGYADRMYVGDMAAQLWRFDITNGSTANDLVAGGVMASLGAKALTGSPSAAVIAANARRFYNKPDVAALQRPGQPPILNIAIGSGYRGHPLNTATQDRFYAIRDLQPFGKLTQAQYNAITPTLDSGLMDITNDLTPTIAANSPGWKLLLNLPSWRGEKSLSNSNTFDNKIFFTTYTPPETGADSDSCSAGSTGSNRVYAVNALDGSPVPRRDAPQIDPETGEVIPGDDEELTAEDRFDELAQGGIAPEVSFLFPEKDEVVCLSGVEVLNVCTNFNSRIKTYWRESNAN